MFRRVTYPKTSVSWLGLTEIALKKEDNVQALELKRMENRKKLAEERKIVRMKEAEAEAKQEFERVRQSKGLVLSVSRDNVVHFSALPWINFSGITHARDLESQDCSPKITFGKITQNHGRWLMPVSVHVHHGLVYGKDVGLVVMLLQRSLDFRTCGLSDAVRIVEVLGNCRSGNPADRREFFHIADSRPTHFGT